MPIYAYRCANCGHEKDVLRKLSDAPLTQCPACGKDTFSKQVTAAGFQLKGSGWYVTDFRGGNSGAGSGKSAPNEGSDASNASASKTEDASAGAKSGESATPASTSSTDAAKPAAGSSGSSASSGPAASSGAA